MELTDKEKKILEDQLKAEYICINKYKLYADQASDPQIKNAFNLAHQQEVQHANSLKALLEQGGFNPPTPIS
ncbi:MAG TPA: ferritin-like domain-containing protein [Clostridia bacterium]|nr:ferritin-like domain-containing protein [Clostridia bacterium]